jgi:hypothetical protein
VLLRHPGVRSEVWIGTVDAIGIEAPLQPPL